MTLKAGSMAAEKFCFAITGKKKHFKIYKVRKFFYFKLIIFHIIIKVIILLFVLYF